MAHEAGVEQSTLYLPPTLREVALFTEEQNAALELAESFGVRRVP